MLLNANAIAGTQLLQRGWRWCGVCQGVRNVFRAWGLGLEFGMRSIIVVRKVFATGPLCLGIKTGLETDLAIRFGVFEELLEPNYCVPTEGDLPERNPYGKPLLQGRRETSANCPFKANSFLAETLDPSRKAAPKKTLKETPEMLSGEFFSRALLLKGPC